MQKNAIVESSPLLTAALQYAASEWHIIPLHTLVDGSCTCEKPTCGSPAKHPITPNGVHGATTDEETIRRWWAETQGIANVGIATGENSDLVVLDVDARHGGLETLARLEQIHGKLPATPTAKTGGGGRHFYFRYPHNVAVGNRAGICPGLDVRGDGGYVVAPPSVHSSGQTYAWEVAADTPLAEVPAWLLDLMLGKTSPEFNTGTAATLVVESASDDLATHPGVGEGERNAVLCRLVGSHLGRGEDAEDILPLALAWAERCSPPLPEAEVTRTVQSLATKHQRTATTLLECSQGDSDLDHLPLPEPPPWPVLDDAAYHGLAGEIVRTLEPESEADPVALLLSLLVGFGNLVGRKSHFCVEGDKHYGNLFLTIVGASGTGRKGTSLGRILSLFEAVDDQWCQHCQASGLSSGEGLIWAIRDAIESVEPVKEKGKVIGYQDVIRDPGISDKRLLVVESEFAQALRVLRREGNTLSPIVRAAWDKGNLRTLTKNSQARATDAHISIVGHITLPELRAYLSDTDLWNGFANRFLWALVKRSKLLPDGGRQLDLSPLKQRLAEAYKKASMIDCMQRSPAARDLWWSLYPSLTAGHPGLAGAATGRGEAQTLRLSLLYALLGGSPIIDVPHLEAAHAVWRYCQESAHTIFGAESEDPLQRHLAGIIHRDPGINRRGLHKAVGGHVPAAALVQALATLRNQGLVRCETIATSGRPAERWYPPSAPLCKGTDQPTPANEGLCTFARDPAPPSNDGLCSFARDQSSSKSTNGDGAVKATTEPTEPKVGDAEPPPASEETFAFTEEEFFRNVRPDAWARLDLPRDTDVANNVTSSQP